MKAKPPPPPAEKRTINMDPVANAEYKRLYEKVGTGITELEEMEKEYLRAEAGRTCKAMPPRRNIDLTKDDSPGKNMPEKPEVTDAASSGSTGSRQGRFSQLVLLLFFGFLPGHLLMGNLLMGNPSMHGGLAPQNFVEDNVISDITVLPFLFLAGISAQWCPLRRQCNRILSQSLKYLV